METTIEHDDIKYISKDREINDLFTNNKNIKRIVLRMPANKTCIQINNIALYGVNKITMRKATSDFIILYFYNKYDDIISSYYLFDEDFKNFEYKHWLQFDKITYITE